MSKRKHSYSEKVSLKISSLTFLSLPLKREIVNYLRQVEEGKQFRDAYSVDDESSGDDFVDGNGKGIDVDDKGKRVMESNSGAVKKRKKSDIIGNDKEKGESSKASTSKPKKEKGKKPYITKLQLIGEMLGIKNEGVDLMAEVNANDDEIVKDWDSQFKKGKEITPSYLKSLFRKSKVADMNFKLNFIVLFTSILYVDGTVCNAFNVGRKRPPTSFWTIELLKEREYEEINARGIGKGALQGPFVEEDDPMPEDEDGFLWKLNTYVANIRKERDGFERTFVAASNVLRGNPFIVDVYQQYRALLHYKNVGNEGNSCSDLNGDNNDEPHQEEVFTRVDKVVEEFESSKKGNDFEPPSFSFGVTQDFDMVLSLETPVTDRNTFVLGSANQSEPINAVPLSMCKPVLKDENVVHGREYSRKIFAYKIGIDQSAILFENEIGTKASRKQMESLVNGENIDNAVVDAWSEYLNSLESLRGENSMSRFFLPTFIVDKKMFGNESKANKSITNFLMDVETLNERAGRKNIINLVDLVFIPVSNYGHKFLICINMKFPAVNMIDSKNNLTKEGYHKSIIVNKINDMVVATVLQKSFCDYLARLNPNKAIAVLRVEVTREDFYWQTDKRPNDYGVFLMRHMEAYMGTIISKWACGLETEGRKQITMLGRLRKRSLSKEIEIPACASD
ncbi:C2 calcium-dependent membrane-targeting protein [Tanacetum coccineum]